MKHVAISVSDAIAAPELFGAFFAGPSWDTWRAVVKAMFGEPLSPAELVLFHAVAERDPPQSPVREMAAVAGRGAGKDSIATVIAAVMAVNFDPLGKLRPGERAVVMLLAVDREQAKIAFNYIAALFREIPALAKLVRRTTDDSIELTNSVDVEVHTNSFRSVRGRSLLCVICDECSFWRSEDSSNPDREVVAAVQPGLGRIAGSMLILISSAHKRSGLLYERWKNHYGRNDDGILVVKGGTLQFNPTFDHTVIERALIEDRALFGAEYLSEWRDDLATFISRQLLEAAVDTDVIVRPPQEGVSYFAFDDPSGGARDSYTLGIAHQDARGDNVILDLLYERFAPMNPYEVTNEIAALLRSYRCTQVTGDDYGKRWVTDAYGQIGITRLKSELDRSGIYLNVLPLFTSGRARLLDNQRLINQFADLERRTFPSGKDKIDHERGRHDDLCNAAAGALTLAARRVIDYNAHEFNVPIYVGQRRNIPGQSYGETMTVRID